MMLETATLTIYTSVLKILKLQRRRRKCRFKKKNTSLPAHGKKIFSGPTRTDNKKKKKSKASSIGDGQRRLRPSVSLGPEDPNFSDQGQKK